MSESREILADVINDRQTSGFGDTVTLPSGERFTAELEDVEDIELNTDLGRDARESILVHITDRAIVAAINIGDKLGCTLFGVPVLLEVLRRKDNPLDPQAEFGCAKVVIGKDR